MTQEKPDRFDSAHQELGPSSPEMADAYAVVDAMKPFADRSVGAAPVWFGWALREAYLRGVLAERARTSRVNII